MSKIVSDKNTVHIALATYPQNQSSQYVEDIREYFKGFKKRLSENFVESATFHDNLYKPLTYHIFGNYDVAYISIVDSYKFGQKIFLPKVEDIESEGKAVGSEKINGYNPNSYQILTGISLIKESEKELIAVYDEVVNKKFIGIINLKLNNGLYIGTGQDLINRVVDKTIALINEVMDVKEDGPKTSNFIINQSFSWFELTVLFFVDDSQLIPRLISKLRSLTLGDIDEDGALEANSLYKAVFSEKGKLKESHVFIDTNSYFGANYDSFISGNLNEEQLCTQVEFQIKPGHYSQVIKGINAFTEGEPNSSIVVDEAETKFLIGKNDFVIYFKNDLLQNNYNLYRSLRKENGIGKYIKRIKTTVLACEFESDSTSNDIIDWGKKLKRLSFSHVALENIETFLLELKVSRQIREKIVKILFNYNSGILDRVMFTYFLDFSIFLRNFINTILSDYWQFKYCFYQSELNDTKFNENKKRLLDNSEKYDCNWKEILNESVKKFNSEKEHYFKGGYTFEPINELEERYITIIRAFEEGYHLRLLNGYVFEEMYDLDVDFNSSIQQLLTSYNTLVAEMANYYYPEKYSSGMLVQLNLQNTVSNDVSINYNAYHLTSPEFVFFTLEKEILNPFIKNTISNLDSEFFSESFLSNFMSGANSTILKTLYSGNKIDLKYLFIDYSRLILSCNGESELFTYWFWTYNLQNSSLYDSLGKFNEDNFKNELIRLLLVLGLDDLENLDNLECPIPEMYVYWNRYYFRYKEASKILITELIKSGFKNKIFEAIFKEGPEFTITLGKNNDMKEWLSKNNLGLDFLWCYGFNLKKIDYLNNSFDMIFNLPYFAALNDSIDKSKKDDLPELPSFTEVFEIINSLEENGLEIGEKNISYHAFIYTFLKLIYVANKKNVKLLRRNWENAKPIKSFLKNDKERDFLFYTEQLGGTFHAHADKLNDYFKLENGIIQTVFHLGAIKKKELIQHYLNI